MVSFIHLQSSLKSDLHELAVKYLKKEIYEKVGKN